MIRPAMLNESAPPRQLNRSTAFILRKRTWQSNPAHASFLQQYWNCGNNAWQEDIGDHHRAGVAACLYRRAETAKAQAGWPECVGNFAIDWRPGPRGSGRDACLQFRPRTLGDPGVILGYDRGPRFDQASPGAKVGKIAPDHIELGADGGWDLLIETDGQGRLAEGTHVAFPVKLGGRPLKFNCRPADPTVGYLYTTARTGSDELEGSFQLEVAICKNAVSGKTAAWPYQPLKVRGNFAGLKKQG